MYLTKKPSPRKLNQTGFVGKLSSLVVFFVFLAAIFYVFEYVAGHSGSAIPEIKSGITNYCLDVHRDSTANQAEVDSWRCNGTAAQNWAFSSDLIKHGNDTCLGIQHGRTTAGDKIVASHCDGSLGQVWTSAIGGYENPNSALCLAVPGGVVKAQLTASSCDDLTKANELWSPATRSKNNSTAATLSCNSGTQGQAVACYAAKQWVLWQSGDISHKTLLNNYSIGNGYEEWCADFISYIYKQAGYPFTQGERNGWDEYLANNIQNMGFKYHPAAGYVPQPGDIAYFDYPGGHVEIVAVGGSKPIFIYGDSGATDPTTGNGDMAENSITSDGSLGQLVYYLSPDQN